MRQDWALAYYDATRALGSKLYIQAEFSGTSDIDWVAAGRKFAARHEALRPILEANKGEFKSTVYFATLNTDELRRYTSLYQRLRDGPRLAHLYIYAMDEFSRIGREIVDVQEEDVPRLPKDLKRDLYEQVGIATLNTSPIANFQDHVIRARIPNYRPSLDPRYFDPAQITADLKYDYRNIVQVAARTEAVFGDLKRIEPDPNFRTAAAVQRLYRLLRTDRYFDKDYERALAWVLAGLLDLELSLMLFEPRIASVDEHNSALYDGIQAADIAAAVARKISGQLAQGGQPITHDALTRLAREFKAVTYNGIRQI